ncbi:MAG: CvpA family protein [Lachnospiraceae bacterium]|nr:CvpA family protein [Lachnospiraceae bacterium]
MEITYLFIFTVIIIVWFAIYGACVGFLRLFLYLIGLVLSIVLMVKCTPYVSDFLIQNTPIQNTVETYVREVFTAGYDDNGNEDEAIENMELPDIAKNLIISNNTDEVYKQLLVEKFADYVAKYISKLLINILAFLVCVILINMLYRFLLAAFEVVDRIPIINGLNRLSGFLAGIVQGLLILELIYLAMIAFSGTEWGSKLYEMAGKNMITAYLYENNLLLMVISSLVLL